jgi:hypothetical protein
VHAEESPRPSLSPVPESALRRWSRAGFDRFERGLAASALAPGIALAAAAAVGAMRARLSGRWPSAAEVSSLFGTGLAASRRIAVGIAANEARNRLVLRRTSGLPLAPFAGRVRFEDAAPSAGLEGPRVLVTAHIGAIYLLAAALDRLGGDRLVLRWSPLHRTASGEESLFTSAALATRTEALRRGLEGLRGGKIVVTALEGPHGATLEGRLLGRELAVGQGGFALARMAGVPIAPVAALWQGNRVTVAVGPATAVSPASGPSSAVSAARELTAWFERRLRLAPANLGLGLLRELLAPVRSEAALAPPAVGPAGENPTAV